MVEGEAGGGQRRVLGHAVRWGDLDDVHCNEVDPVQTTNDPLRLEGGQPPGHRGPRPRSPGPRPRCAGRVEAVDVERSVPSSGA